MSYALTFESQPPMILALTSVALALVVVFLGAQVYWAWRLALHYPPPESTAVQDEKWPRVAVILPTRGADPSLVDCLENLLSLDYPHYDVRIIVDSEDDPAWDIVRDVLAKRPAAPVRVALLENRRESCSLKVSALLQALDGLDESVQTAALIDGDVIPYPQWLRDLVRPLRDPAVGATTGVRWYVAAHANWGTLVRTTWNAAAATQMYAFDIPWAGSMAFRTDLLLQSDVRAKWARCFCEDVPLYGVLSDLGLRLHLVPSATMMNGERVGLKSCFVFIRRQLLSVRLYHRRWPLVVAAGVGLVLAMAVVVAVLAMDLAAGEWAAAGVLGGALAMWVIGLASAMARIDGALRGMAARRGGTVPWPSPRIVPAALLTPLVHLAALLSAIRMRKVEWRGVTYELLGPLTLRMVEYRPYRPAAEAADTKASVL